MPHALDDFEKCVEPLAKHDWFQKPLERARDAIQGPSIPEVRTVPGTASSPRPDSGTRIIYLPRTPLSHQPLPDQVLRSALFGIVRRGQRDGIERAEMPSYGRFRIFYTGLRLDQSDLDVWEEILNRAREVPLGNPVYVTAHGFLRSIGRSTGRSDHLWLKRAWARLSSATIEVFRDDDKRASYHGHLVEELLFDEGAGKMFFRLNPALAKLFDAGWSAIERHQRQSLRKDLAKWLHAFYATHAQPHPIAVTKIRALCGSRTTDLSKFRQELRAALEQVAEVGAILRWHIDRKTDHLFVSPALRPSQRRYLEGLRQPSDPGETTEPATG